MSPLELNPESSVLVKFPLEVRRDIIAHVLAVLLNPQSPPDILGSTFSIQWVMEAIGQSFALPISEHDIIKNGITIYEHWFNGRMLPPRFEEHRNKFFREMFGHISLLFSARPDLISSAVETHVELCLPVIQILSALGSRSDRFEYMDKETIHHLLNVILGISDYLFTGEGATIEPMLSSELTPHLLKLLFDLWINSQTQDISMWIRFKECATRWTHRLETVVQWSSTIYGLINTLLHLMYGPNQGTKEVIVLIPPSTKNNFSPFKTILEPDLLIFFWQKLLNIIGNPNNIQDPVIFLQAMDGIKDIVTLLLLIGNRPSFEYSTEISVIPDHPDGNSILHIFGEWLFDAVSLNRPGFAEGTESAFSILSWIFMSIQTRPFLDTYTSRFYESIVSAFENPTLSGRSIAMILSRTSNIFLSDLPGVYILLPQYLSILPQILVRNQPPPNSSIPLKFLRRACITIAQSLISLPNYFGSTSIQPFPLGSISVPIYNFNDIRVHVTEILLKSFESEEDFVNAEMILWAVNTLVHEEIHGQNNIVNEAVAISVNFLANPSPDWPIEVSAVAIHSLSALSSLVPVINSRFPDLIPDTTSKLADLIIKYISLPSLAEDEDRNLLATGFFSVLAEYVQADQWILGYPAILKLLMKAIEISFEEPIFEKKRRKTGQTPEIKHAAEFLFGVITNLLGNFPLPVGPTSFSSFVTEDQLMTNYMLSDDEFARSTRFFVLNTNKIVTVFDVPQHLHERETTSEGRVADDKEVFIIVRDKRARYSWKLRFRALPLSFEAPETIATREFRGEPRPPVYQPYQPKPDHVIHETSIMFDTKSWDILSAPNELSHSCLVYSLGFQHRIEEVYRFFQEEAHPISAPAKRPVRVTDALISSNFTNARVFLTNIGLFQPLGEDHFDELAMGPPLNKAISTLDRCPEREQLAFSVLYVGAGQNRMRNMDGIFEHDKGSPKYEEFIQRLGWKIDTSSHTGYCGALNPGKTTYYFSDFRYEVVYYISTLLEVGPTFSVQAKKDLFGRTRISIVWLEDDRPINPRAIKFNKNQLFIIIRPHYTGLYSIQIQNFAQKSFVHGPLSDQMLVSWRILPDLVRKTAILSDIDFSNIDKTRCDPQKIREGNISAIAQKFKLNQTMDSFYSHLFSSSN